MTQDFARDVHQCAKEQVVKGELHGEQLKELIQSYVSAMKSEARSYNHQEFKGGDN